VLDETLTKVEGRTNDPMAGEVQLVPAMRTSN
jgi:hypothetical protein